MTAGVAGERWSRTQIAALVLVLIAGIAIRLVLLPTNGFRPDLDQFVLWVHGIAIHGLGNAYDQDISFGPVIATIWGVFARIEPAFRTATDASDPALRVLMKVPATLADFGLAAIVANTLWGRPKWAVVGTAAILLHPAVIDVSAWWGQYESVYVLWAVLAAACAIRGRVALAAGFVALAILTKPQALPFLVPFAAWFWARFGWRGLSTGIAAGVVVAVVVWMPFLAAGGPIRYIDNLFGYQSGVFNVLSLRAWNAWWLFQEATVGGGRFLADDVAVLGPVTLRQLSYGVVALGWLVVGFAIARDPRPTTLVLGLAASSLLAFAFLTSMHERYAFAVVAFLAMSMTDRRLRWAALAFAIVFSANLLAAIPPTPEVGALLPVAGVAGVAGSIAMLILTGLLVWWLLRASQDYQATEPGLRQGLSFRS